ncbi:MULTISPECIES: universal stress protein [unclassified Pseudonocardia]|jgi:nucleotide-binding universal stress UspA family protein|uniref:universal stress protein n=1 Tax=unclassified Pseudonocardia TaxID=2619320 RepID=UPI0009600F6D|nr:MULTISPECIES: universal stress protein [unclassified Pseudonocardia]MBN9101041.1 universal stress protein [Pseudonocardia sp.]OJY53966.1 MAG: hypothetical protein BGP03_19615 [Pseudonocardia sp. 73-21]
MDGISGRIVVGVDGSPGGHAALRNAIAEGARRGAVVEVVTAYPDPRPGVLGGVPQGFPGALPQVLRELLHDRTSAEAAALLTELPGPRPRLTVFVGAGDPADVLLRAAAGADLLVVGTHRHGHLAGMLLGSVGRCCVLHSPCPVTVVHAPPSAPERVRSRVGGGPAGGR